MDSYTECLNALQQISRAFEESGPSEARALVDEALVAAEHIAAEVESRLRDEYTKRQFFETVISSMADGVAVADAEQNITLVNEAAQDLFGKHADEEPLRVGAIGIHFPDGTPTPVEDMPLSKGLRGERFVDYEIVLVRPDGARRYVRTSGAPIRSHDHKITGAVVVMHDLTIEHEFREQLEDQRDKLQAIYEREHYRTEVLQRSLLPSNTIQVQGYKIAATYRPAREEERIGGDFYDSFRLPDDRTAFCIGDVSGKGVEAATFTALARDCIRTLLLDTPKPAAVLKKLNKALCVYLPEDYFVTVFLAILEPRTGKLIYASAGHDPPIIYRSKLNGAVELKIQGGLAGIFSDLTYKQRIVTLESGDALLLYTDGLADARRDGLVLGSSGLASLLSEKIGKEPEQIIDEIYDYAVDFAGGTLHDDAAAILICSRTGEVA